MTTELGEKMLRRLLACVAYYLQKGCFRACWVRLGYDPREHALTCIYQVLDVR